MKIKGVFILRNGQQSRYLVNLRRSTPWATRIVPRRDSVTVKFVKKVYIVHRPNQTIVS